ncbi:hypothetical protein F9K94_19815 [Brucella tritici]|uniref:Uncharacterized protein n=1 Tax=Brucella tritici TaxID=94626 RepID=A0A7V7VRQ0_9HYPH|nr:hypothetical protein F9K94_19815 [Brucella tritici]
MRKVTKVEGAKLRFRAFFLDRAVPIEPETGNRSISLFCRVILTENRFVLLLEMLKLPQSLPGSRVSAVFCPQGLEPEMLPEIAGCTWPQENINHTS